MRQVLIVAYALSVLLSSSRMIAERGVIAVRAVDARNGKPYRKLHLRVDLLRHEWSSQVYPVGSNPWAENLIATKLLTTDDQGEVTFELPSSLPGIIWVFSGPMACGTEYFDTQAVIKEGVVGENHCKTRWTKMGANFQARPGEIIYFATHVGFFEGALKK